MSTRALIRIYDEQGEEFCTIYKHWDGYPGHLGSLLKSLLEDVRLVEGIPLDKNALVANGMYDLAAQLVYSLKRASPVGDVYIRAPGTRGVGEEFVYHIRPGKQGRVVMEIEEV